MNLETNPVLYAGLIQIRKRGTAEILEETENGIFLLDTVSNGVMLAVENVETGMQWLRKHSSLPKKDDTAFLCWPYSPEVTYVLEYTPSKIDDSEIIKMAESAEPVK